MRDITINQWTLLDRFVCKRVQAKYRKAQLIQVQQPTNALIRQYTFTYTTPTSNWIYIGIPELAVLNNSLSLLEKLDILTSIIDGQLDTSSCFK